MTEQDKEALKEITYRWQHDRYKLDTELVLFIDRLLFRNKGSKAEGAINGWRRY